MKIKPRIKNETLINAAMLAVFAVTLFYEIFFLYGMYSDVQAIAEFAPKVKIIRLDQQAFSDAVETYKNRKEFVPEKVDVTDPFGRQVIPANLQPDALQ